MKKLQLILLSLICIANGFGQTATNSYGEIEAVITKEKHPSIIYTKVEIKKAFPAGDSAWVASLERRITESARKLKRVKKGKYIVSAIFIVAKDGSLSDVRCERDPGYGIGEIVMRVLIRSSRWIPAGGVPVRVVQ
jgi:hypothetical protein